MLVRSGDVAGDSAADARASLRSIGLRVVDLRPARSSFSPGIPAVGRMLASYCCRRRAGRRGEMYDSLATMLDSGLPMLEGVESIAAAAGRSGAMRAMLTQVRERLKSGSSLGEAMKEHKSWFDSAEVAMVAAGQHRGELARVLHRAAERHERAGELMSKLVGVLAYPLLVSFVGVGVVVFLSTRTLPDLVAVLQQSKIEPPRLTAAMMWGGQALWTWWPLTIAVFAGAVGTVAAILSLAGRQHVRFPNRIRRLVPAVFRKIALARMCVDLSEMMHAGVPLVEGLRVLSPTLLGPVSASLGRCLETAADRVERGEAIDAALDDPIWFDPEFSRLLATGRASGELGGLLARLGQRELRRTARLVDRLAAVLEPAVILALAGLVGTVVMAAVLPLIRLQEVL